MTNPFNSLRGRFVVAMLLWVVLGTSAIWYSATALFTKHIEAEFHDELNVHVRELAGLSQLDQNGNPELARPLSDPRYVVPLSGFYWQVTRDGRQALKSASMTKGSLDANIARSSEILHETVSGPTGPTITYGLRQSVSGGVPLRFSIATDQRHLDSIISAFTRDLTVWLAVLAAALIASGIGIITFGLRPLSRLAKSISDMRSGRNSVLQGEFPSEIQPVITNLNSYAQRNNAIVERARVQAGNLAHSLRTPLAVVTDEAERMVELGDAPERARVFLDETERMQRHINYHLSRARSSGTRQMSGAQSVLSEILPPLLSAMRHLYPAKIFIAPLDLATVPVLACDPDDLHEILSNLIDNAGKWSAKTVTIDWRTGGNALTISVCDDGPGISEDKFGAAFEVGTRFDSKIKGTGLGLAISRDIARDYGHEILLERRTPTLFCAKLTMGLAG